MPFWRRLAHATAPARVSHSTSTRLSGRWLLLSWAAWLSVVIPGVILSILSIPIIFAQIEQVCTGAASDTTCLRPRDLQALEQWGLSPAFVATSNVVLFLVVFLVFMGLGTLLFWRKSAEPHTRFFGFCLVLAGIQFTGLPTLLAVVPPAWWVPVSALFFLTSACTILFVYLFPNGRFVPRWTRWAALAGILSNALVDFFPGSPLVTWPAAVVVLDLGLYVPAIVAQVSRYRHHSTPVERQQIKWVVLALVLYLLLSPAWDFVPSEGGAAHLLVLLALNLIFSGAVLLVPLAITLSILHYRLWEIDALINKVLVYGLLTALLAGVYAGLILGLQALLRGVIEQNNNIALVVSTLAIAALFHPLRRRVQTLIDRRFYRQKYDTASTLATFSALLSTEVDVGHLGEQIVAVVQETMHPTFVSLWLVKPQKRAAAISPEFSSPSEMDRS